MQFPIGIVLAVMLTLPPSHVGRQDVPPLDLGAGDAQGARRVDPADFAVTVFADGLYYPLGMTELADGSILVGTSNPTEGGFFGSTGELIRLVDADGDGEADGPGDIVASGLPGSITAVRRADDLIYAVGALPEGSRISVLRAGESPAGLLTFLGTIDFIYEVPMLHGTFALAVRSLPGEPDRHELFFNVGSVGNDESGQPVYLGGLASGTLNDAAIYRLRVDDSGPLPIFSAPDLIATGLRNAAGLAFHPETGDLYFEDNGIDGYDDPIVAFSADELNRIPAAAIGGEIEDFGFPDAYVDYRTGQAIGQRGQPPIVAFLPRGAPHRDESEGASEIAFAPTVFPEGLNDGVVVGFHGQWDEVGLDNDENPLLYVDLATGDYFPLVGNDEPAVGHLDGLLATADALYVSDLTGTGSLSGTEPTGVIYRIAPVEGK